MFAPQFFLAYTTALLFLHGAGRSALALSASDFGRGMEVGKVNSDPLGEASGLAASRRNAGVLWTLNDSGESNHVFAINDRGAYLGSFVLDGAVAGDCQSLECVGGALDYEDIAVGPGPVAGTSYLYVGDIGSAGGTRTTVEVHRILEPEVDAEGGDQSAILGGVETLSLRYPDRYRDAETLLVDPWSGDVYIVTKDRDENNRVYRAAAPHALDNTIALEYMGEMGWELAVGGDVLFNGLEVIMKSKKSVYIYSRAEGTELSTAITRSGDAVTLQYNEEPKGEAIAFASDGAGYYTLSESVGAQSVPLFFNRRDGPVPALGVSSEMPTPPAQSGKLTEPSAGKILRCFTFVAVVGILHLWLGLMQL